MKVLLMISSALMTIQVLATELNSIMISTQFHVLLSDTTQLAKELSAGLGWYMYY